MVRVVLGFQFFSGERKVEWLAEDRIPEFYRRPIGGGTVFDLADDLLFGPHLNHPRVRNVLLWNPLGVRLAVRIPRIAATLIKEVSGITLNPVEQFLQILCDGRFPEVVVISVKNLARVFPHPDHKEVGRVWDFPKCNPFLQPNGHCIFLPTHR